MVDVAVRIGSHGENAYVHGSAFGAGHPELRTAPVCDWTHVLRTLGFAHQQFLDTPAHLIDRPGDLHAHTSSAVAKPVQMVFRAVDVIVIVVPIRHHAVEHTQTEVK